MKKTTDIQPVKPNGDLVLQQVWHAKETLSARYGYNLDRLFAETSQREASSDHLFANLPIKRRKV